MKPYPYGAPHLPRQQQPARRDSCIPEPRWERGIEMTRTGNPASSHEAERIRSALQEQLTNPDQDLATLRNAICAFVAMLRDLGFPPERMLVSVKEVVRSVQATPQGLDRQRELTSLVAEWCVKEYYRTSTAD